MMDRQKEEEEKEEAMLGQAGRPGPAEPPPAGRSSAAARSSRLGWGAGRGRVLGVWRGGARLGARAREAGARRRVGCGTGVRRWMR